MSLVLSYCKDEDFPTLTDIIFGATDGGPADKCDPLFDALYPHWNTPEGRQSHCRRFIHWRNVDNCAHWLKVTDIDTDEIIACGQWAIYGNAPTAVFVATPTLLDTYDTPEEEEYGDAVFKAFHKEREKVQKEISGSLLCLNFLQVHPKRQRRGAGSMVLKWGTELADQIGAQCIVEASEAGLSFYQKYGFELQHTYQLELPEKFAGQPTETMAFMRRK